MMNLFNAIIGLIAMSMIFGISIIGLTISIINKSTDGIVVFIVFLLPAIYGVWEISQVIYKGVTVK